MTKPAPVSSAIRAFKAAAVLGVVACQSSLVVAAPVPVVSVVSLEATPTADLVLLGHGFNAGLRQGMVCRLTRDGAVIGEVVLVELRPTCASALIVSLAPGQSIRAGDVASVKILKT